MIVAALIEAGAKTETPDEEGFTPLFYAVGKTTPLAPPRPNLEIVTALIQAGADVNVEVNGGLTPLMYAAGAGAFEHAPYCGEEDISAYSPSIVNTLLDAGANINAAHPLGGTALCAAALRGHLPIVEALLSRGADVNIASAHGITALMRTAHAGTHSLNGEPGNDSFYGNAKLIYTLTDPEHACRVNAVDNEGRTALIEAARLRRYNSIVALLTSGADPDISDSSGQTFKHFLAESVYHGRKNLVEACVDSAIKKASIERRKYVLFRKNRNESAARYSSKDLVSSLKKKNSLSIFAELSKDSVVHPAKRARYSPKAAESPSHYSSVKISPKGAKGPR